MPVINTRDVRQGIMTRYFGPTNARSSRVKATAQAGSVTVPWDHGLNIERNHAAAAMALAAKYGWESDNWAMGADTVNGFMFVRLEEV